MNLFNLFTIKKYSSKRKKAAQAGFTLVELLIVLFIISILSVVIGEFQSKVFTYNRILTTGNNARFEGTKVVKQIAAEMRAMGPSSAGGYPIEAAGTSSIIFYNDVDDDGIKERIRYYISGKTLYKASMKPIIDQNGQTLTTETITTVITNVINTSADPIFSYFDTNYNGAESSATSTAALPLPINISKIRLIQIRVLTDNSNNEPLAPLELRTQTSIRNLKDNL